MNFRTKKDIISVDLLCLFIHIIRKKSPVYILQIKKAGDGNRTHVSSLEGWCSTIELHPHVNYIILMTNLFLKRCPEPESNQRHRDFQSLALPTELSGLIILLLPFLSTRFILARIFSNVNMFFEISQKEYSPENPGLFASYFNSSASSSSLISVSSFIEE